VQRCRVTNRRQPAGQEQALSSHFVGSRGTVLVSIETFQTVSEEFFSETRSTEGSNLSHTYSDAGIFETGTYVPSGAYESLIKVIHTLNEYAKSCSRAVQGRMRAEK
jgi:hypothetical protein